MVGVAFLAWRAGWQFRKVLGFRTAIRGRVLGGGWRRGGWGSELSGFEDRRRGRGGRCLGIYSGVDMDRFSLKKKSSLITVNFSIIISYLLNFKWTIIEQWLLILDEIALIYHNIHNDNFTFDKSLSYSYLWIQDFVPAAVVF